MSQSHITKPITVLAILLILLAVIPGDGRSAETYRLDNGMEVILKENHASPMVSSIVFVRSGSKYESQYENGITHFLEHLLFDGTVTMAREEIDASIRDKGGYLNAFTRQEMTAYLTLLPKQYIEFGMTVQADMLFNSLFPPEELIKERKVVIEEIRRGADGTGYAADKFFTEMAYAETDYARPVLGFEPFIANIPAEAIIDYWKRYYIPRNMTLLVIGDFEPAEMKTKVEAVFGGFKNLAKAETTDRTEMESGKRRHGRITGQSIHRARGNVKSTYVNFSFDAPHFSDSSYLSLDLLSSYLSLDEISPLKAALTSGADPLASEVGIGLVTYDDFSRLEVSVLTEQAANVDTIVATVLDQLKNISNTVADEEVLTSIKVSNRCDEIYTSEKLHYYGFMIAPRMMTVGWDFIQNYSELLEPLTWTDCQAAAHKWLDNPNYIATVMVPADSGETDIYQPTSMSSEDVLAFFETASFPEYDLISQNSINYPATDSVTFALVDKAEYRRVILSNGLTLLVKSSQDSRVFSMNVLGKNRSASESDGTAGITDFVNRCIEKGTTTRNAEQLNRDLTAIGANVTLYDNPWIPYDDRYTTRQFSFMKFETIDDFAREGFDLFSEMLISPAFDSAGVENVRQSMMGMLGRSAGSPSKVARNLFYSTLFAGGAYSRPISGDMATISRIDAAALKAHHARVYAPQNLIIAIASNLPIDTIVTWVKERYAFRPAVLVVAVSAEVPERPTGVITAHEDMDKEQIAIYLGNLFPGANHPDIAALNVATSILSSRLYLNLRERQGLAYSVGAGMKTDPEFGWYYCTIATGSENRQTALDGIMLEIQKLKLDGPDPDELDKARNQIWGRLMSAKLSRINQAYYMCIDEYLKHEPGQDAQYLKQLASISLEDIRRVMSRYFSTDNYVLATAGKLAE